MKGPNLLWALPRSLPEPEPGLAGLRAMSWQAASLVHHIPRDGQSSIGWLRSSISPMPKIGQWLVLSSPMLSSPESSLASTRTDICSFSYSLCKLHHLTLHLLQPCLINALQPMFEQDFQHIISRDFTNLFPAVDGVEHSLAVVGTSTELHLLCRSKFCTRSSLSSGP